MKTLFLAVTAFLYVCMHTYTRSDILIFVIVLLYHICMCEREYVFMHAYILTYMLCMLYLRLGHLCYLQCMHVCMHIHT